MIEFESFCFLQNHKTGCTLVTGMTMHPTGLSECLVKAAQAINWGKKDPPSAPNKRRGKGIALMWRIWRAGHLRELQLFESTLDSWRPPAELRQLSDRYSANVALDGADDPVYLAPNNVYLIMVKEKYPNLRFDEAREVI